MKIALVANTDWYLYNFRLSLAKYLQKQGLQVVLISPPGIYSEKMLEQGFRWIPWQVGRQSMNLFTEIKALLALKEIYRREGLQMVHHHTVKPVLYGSIAARMAHIPRVVNSITGLGYLFVSQEWRARLIRHPIQWIYRLLPRRSKTAYIFENQSDQQFFLKNKMAAQKYSWLIRSVGVDIDTFVPLPEPVGIPVALIAGRLLWDKGLAEFMQAARLLKQRCPIKMVLVGLPDPGNPSSIPEETVRGWVEEGLVEWWGWQNDMPQVYNRAHIVVLASYSEGVPTALIEAAACGRALIGTDIAGCREVIRPGENGLLIPVKDAAALADAIEQLANQPELRLRFGRAARQTVESHFSALLVNQQTELVYCTLEECG
jgi:glycosyltransferase involved in cell wall biosynthesis